MMCSVAYALIQTLRLGLSQVLRSSQQPTHSCVIGFQLRHAPAVLRLKELAASRAVHAVRTIATVPMYHPSVEAAYSSGGPRACDLLQSATGGALVSQAIHILDAARFVLGSPKVRRAWCLEGGEQQMSFPSSDATPSGSECGGSGAGAGERRPSSQDSVSSTVQQLQLPRQISLFTGWSAS